MLFGGIDPANDLAAAPEALGAADLVVAVTTHLPESLRGVAHVVLPIGTFAESSGTYRECRRALAELGRRRELVGESRPGWKVLRVLANLLNVHGVDFVSSEEVREALEDAVRRTRRVVRRRPCRDRERRHGAAVAARSLPARPLRRRPAARPWVDIPPYQVDVLVRGSESLAKTKDGHMARAVI